MRQLGWEYLISSQNIRTWQSESCQPALLRPATSHPALQNMSPCGHWLFWGQKMPQRLWYRHQSDKNAIAAQIDPRSGHLKKDRRVASLNFLNSWSPLASIYKIQNQFLARSIFRDFQYSLMKVPIWILGKSLGRLKTFNSFVSGRANINVYPSLERVLYLFVYDRLTWLSRLKPAL